MLSIQSKVEQKIKRMEASNIFSISDFTTLGKYDTIKKVLNRLEKSKKIIRVIDGVYSVPKYSKLTNELIPPSISDIANHLAKKYGWTIVPTGDTCLNYLGLSTQMPALYEYISDGPYRHYDILDFSINFKHTANKEVKNLSYKSAVVVQALKTIGKDNIDQYVIHRIRKNLSVKEKKNLLEECNKITSWVFECLKQIAEGTK